MKRTKATKFRLLPYQAFAKHWLRPAILLVVAGIVFLVLAFRSPKLDQNHTFVGSVITIAGMLIASYTLLAKRAHVSCHKNNFTIHTPLYPVTFSYRRINMIRSVEFRNIFPPENEKTARWRFYREIWGKTTIVITVSSYPMPLWWLKMWFHPYLLHPTESALILLVDDWMALSRSLETQRTNWRENRQKQRRG